MKIKCQNLESKNIIRDKVPEYDTKILKKTSRVNTQKMREMYVLEKRGDNNLYFYFYFA